MKEREIERVEEGKTNVVWRRGGEKYGRVMVENPSSELKRDVVKLNNVCNIYTRESFIRARKRILPPCSPPALLLFLPLPDARM